MHLLRESNRGLFLTNAILCLKQGGLQAKIDPKWVINCGNSFLREQIEIVRPKIVVGLGAKAFKIILAVFQIAKVSLREAIVDRDGYDLCSGTRLFAAYHCGSRVVNGVRDLKTNAKTGNEFGSYLTPNLTEIFSMR